MGPDTISSSYSVVFISEPFVWIKLAGRQRQHISLFLSDTVIALGATPFKLVSLCFLRRFLTTAAVIGYQMNSCGSVNVYLFFTPHSPCRLTTTWPGIWTAPWRGTTGTFWSFTTSASTTSATSVDRTVHSFSPNWWRWTTSWRRFTVPSYQRSASSPNNLWSFSVPTSYKSIHPPIHPSSTVVSLSRVTVGL